MPTTNRLRFFYLCYFSQPHSDRPIYRAIHRHQARTILEIGMGTGRRAVRMIQAAGRSQPAAEIRYTGVDLFEARCGADGPGLTLKTAHRLLKTTGARIQLVPGDPLAALARIANQLGQVDLVIVSCGLDAASLARAWFYVPRMLHEGSLIFLEETRSAEQRVLRRISADEIDRLAAAAAAARRAA